ncbi:MAG: M15 family metallopeptidase [Patescibacteria group bacterium]
MFKALEEYRDRPIPDLEATREAKLGYRQWSLVPSAASHEPCIDIRNAGIAGENHYYRTDAAPYYQRIPGAVPELFLRQSVVEALVPVNTRLATADLQLFVFDAWRPLAIQNHFHDVWFPERIRQQHPAWTEDEVTKEVERYWARGARTQAEIDPNSPPPHATGAALDVTVRKIGGEQLWMGTIFDDVSAPAHTDYLEKNQSSFSEEEGMRNRRLLYWLMSEAGFVNNPTEWWHYSIGDQMWAKLTSFKTKTDVAAYYSAVLPA